MIKCHNIDGDYEEWPTLTIKSHNIDGDYEGKHLNKIEERNESVEYNH